MKKEKVASNDYFGIVQMNQPKALAGKEASEWIENCNNKCSAKKLPCKKVQRQLKKCYIYLCVVYCLTLPQKSCSAKNMQRKNCNAQKQCNAKQNNAN